MVVRGSINLNLIKQMPLKEGKKELKKLVGVGNKVADCILLFASSQTAAFPVDTWVKKVLAEYYNFHESKQEKIDDFVKGYFGEFAGIAQQYLFYYIRKTENQK
jgi:N-glycosylase/DNA lyase